MTRRRGLKATFALCAVPLLMFCASCDSSGGSADDPTGGNADGGSTSGVAPSTSTTPGDLTPRSNLFNTRDVHWSRAEAVSERQIRVHFTGGDLNCYGYYATVEETTTTIAITVKEGDVADSPRLCSAVGLVASLLVDLDAPVGNRQIVHG